MLSQPHSVLEVSPQSSMKSQAPHASAKKASQTDGLNIKVEANDSTTYVLVSEPNRRHDDELLFFATNTFQRLF